VRVAAQPLIILFSPPLLPPCHYCFFFIIFITPLLMLSLSLRLFSPFAAFADIDADVTLR